MKSFHDRWRFYIVSFLIVSATIIWIAALQHKPRVVVTVSFLDVGEGDATLIEGMHGEQVLIDGGPGRNTLTALAKALPFFDRSLDMVVEMFPDKDNSGGLPYVLDQYSVETFISPNRPPQNTTIDEVDRINIEKHTRVIEGKEGKRFNFLDGSYLSIISAQPGQSLILQYNYGGTCILFMGDTQNREERNFIVQHSNFHCQILKVGHHGSKSATSDELLALVHPEYAIFSNSKDNRYEYPDREVIDRLSTWKIVRLDTLEKGTITIELDGKLVQYK